MYVDDLVRTAMRRWPILLAGLLTTAGLSVGVFLAVTPNYLLRAEVLLVPPASEEYVNPFFALGGLESATDVVSRAMMSEEMVQKVVSKGGTDNFTVERDSLVSAPLLAITTSGSRIGSEETMNLLLYQVPDTLDALQAAEDIPARDRIVSSVVSRQSQPSVLRKSQIRVLIVVLGAGLVITGAVAALYDSRQRRRQLAQRAVPTEIEGMGTGRG